MLAEGLGHCASVAPSSTVIFGIVLLESKLPQLDMCKICTIVYLRLVSLPSCLSFRSESFPMGISHARIDCHIGRRGLPRKSSSDESCFSAIQIPLCALNDHSLRSSSSLLPITPFHSISKTSCLVRLPPLLHSTSLTLLPYSRSHC